MVLRQAIIYCSQPGLLGGMTGFERLWETLIIDGSVGDERASSQGSQGAKGAKDLALGKAKMPRD